MINDNTINTCHIQEKKPILCNTSARIDLLQVLQVTCFVAINVSPCAHFGKFFVTCVLPTCAIQAFHPEFQCGPHCREKEVLEYQLIRIVNELADCCSILFAAPLMFFPQLHLVTRSLCCTSLWDLSQYQVLDISCNLEGDLGCKQL